MSNVCHSASRDGRKDLLLHQIERQELRSSCSHILGLYFAEGLLQAGNKFFISGRSLKTPLLLSEQYRGSTNPNFPSYSLDHFIKKWHEMPTPCQPHGNLPRMASATFSMRLPKEIVTPDTFNNNAYDSDSTSHQQMSKVAKHHCPMQTGKTGPTGPSDLPAAP